MEENFFESRPGSPRLHRSPRQEDSSRGGDLGVELQGKCKKKKKKKRQVGDDEEDLEEDKSFGIAGLGQDGGAGGGDRRPRLPFTP